jgi:hypothetical protein
MGIALYRRPRDGAVFAIVGRKEGPREGYLWQYRLQDEGTGKVKATKVREFGRFSGAGEIEAIAVDDALGTIYYADEGHGIHKWHADPDHPDAGRELAVFGRDGFAGDREGIGIYARPDGKGYIICADQLDGSSEFHFYRREGTAGNPHDHRALLKVVRGGADSTDGIEVTSVRLGPEFPDGLLIAMNSSGRNFLLYRWEDLRWGKGSDILPRKREGSEGAKERRSGRAPVAPAGHELLCQSGSRFRSLRAFAAKCRIPFRAAPLKLPGEGQSSARSTQSESWLRRARVRQPFVQSVSKREL